MASSKLASEAEWTREYERVKGSYGNGRSWSGKTLRDMAREIGLEDEYVHVYAYCSNLEHANAASIGQFVRNLPEGGWELLLHDVGDTGRRSATTCLNWGIHFAILVVALLNEECVLGCKNLIDEFALELGQDRSARAGSDG